MKLHTFIFYYVICLVCLRNSYEWPNYISCYFNMYQQMVFYSPQADLDSCSRWAFIHMLQLCLHIVWPLFHCLFLVVSEMYHPVSAAVSSLTLMCLPIATCLPFAVFLCYIVYVTAFLPFTHFTIAKLLYRCFFSTCNTMITSTPLLFQTDLFIQCCVLSYIV